MTQLQTILVLSSTVDKKINVTLENLKENIYKLILPADTKGEEWKLPGRLGSEVVFGNLQSFNFTSLTSNCIGALSETSSSEDWRKTLLDTSPASPPGQCHFAGSF